MKYFTLIFLITIGLLTGCKESEKTKTKKEKVPVETLTSQNTHQIVVLEKIAAGGYVYLKVLEKEKEYWVAVPGRQIKIGATYYYDGGMEMRKFESKSLKRTFESVIFAQGIRDKKNGVKKVEKSNLQKGKSNVVNVEKAPNGIRIATLFENLEKYQNKQVIIKGQVVKVNNGILGVNFLHLQDGTKGNGKYDITVTSNDEFKIGDVVTIKGTVVLNKDFGSGYAYEVLIEKAIIL
ncbi:OB-fold nucleic acid binding domain-containing protein [Polaribacter sp. Hel1_85]|uniref:OB-fold nucleic acid binding domain-containing protein n=1 Tax=Polaribacter sp. Hel1_85 TaxID=1250005 RepID=UPI00052BF069|nr:OB-fold nucleic acid binding domain-containing protein [Polaribacter sp. Hel1_85]KGL62667.1 nucleic acid binding protein, OB-fold protein, tRNA/helicase-type [Polaribacter sp. Hel1_85]